MPTNHLLPAIAFSLLACVPAAAQQAPAPRQGPAGGINGGTNASTPLPGAGLPKPELPPTEAEKTLDQAIKRLKAIVSFSTELVQSVDMLGQKFEIKGVYLRASDYRVYLKLSVVGLPPNMDATTLQVSDGKTLWNYQQVLDSQSVSKLSLTPLLKKLDDPVLDDAIRDNFIGNLGFGGPDAMLVELRKSSRFDKQETETLDGKKYWVISGAWRDRTTMPPPGPNQSPLLAKPLLQPPYIPSNVAIWISQDDGWPLKIEMIGNEQSRFADRDTRRIGPDGKPVGAKGTAQPKIDQSKLVIRYTNIKLNPKVEAETFGWQPPGNIKNIQDGTEDFMTLLDKVVQSETARKKAAAAESEAVIPGRGLDAKAAPDSKEAKPTKPPG